MAGAHPNQTLMIETQDQANEYMRLLQEWIPKRESTIHEIKVIARELQNVKQDVNIAKVVGGAVGVAGGVAAVAGTILTGGLAAPLLVGGIAGAIAGGATSAGAEIAEKYISKDKLESAQKVLNEDAELARMIELVKLKLDSKTRELSHKLNLNFEQVQGALLMTTMIGGMFVFENPAQVLKLLTSSKPLAKMLSTSFGIESAIGKGIASTLAEVSVKGAAKIAGRVLVGVMLVWDIYSLVTNSIDLAKGSPSEASNTLETTAGELAKQVNDLKDLLKRIRDETEDIDNKIREQFRKRLENVSVQGYASDNDTQEIINFLCTYSSHAWQQAFQALNVNLNEFAFHLARVFRNIKQIIEEELNRRRRNHLTIILIAHGRIDTRTMVPCHIYYFSQFMQSVTLYPPWGCAIDASVVYGIATNTLMAQNVQYSAPVRPGIPASWNILPRELTLTPNVKFTPVLVGEGAHQALLELDALLQTSSDGLVIPYFTGMGNNLLPFPEIPLWVCANVVGMCAHFLNITMDLRIAACLSPENAFTTTTAGGYLMGLNQYCQVPMNMIPPAFMTNHLSVAQRINLAINRLSANLPL